LSLAGPKPRLWIVTRGAQHVAGEAAPRAWLQATCWGLGRTLALEAPEVWGGLVDLDPDADAAASHAARLSGVASGETGREVAIRNGATWVPALEPSAGRGAAPALRQDASYLVTGGCGSLGLHVARWMVERGAGGVVLLGRSEPGAQQREIVA